MPPPEPTRRSDYLDHLPAFFQEGDDEGLLSRLLLAFQHVLSGVGDVDDPGLEEHLDGAVDPNDGRVLAGIERIFDPGLRPDGVLAGETERAPDEFLEWLSGWVAITLRPD